MNPHGEIRNLVTEWRLREDVIEKDYAIGWVLWGIGADEELQNSWVFKGGTCLKKSFLETYRFSEDLDFTVLPHKERLAPENVAGQLARVASRVYEASGVDFLVRPPRIGQYGSGQYLQGRLYYRGPRNSPTPASIKLDLNSAERVVRPTVLRPISHPYSDALPPPGEVRCYGFEEVFAEKIRAMAERVRPRDLYDIVNLYRRPDLGSEPALIREVLAEKCAVKQIAVPTFASIEASPLVRELVGEWKNMLAHQLPELPPFEQFWQELRSLFEWLEGSLVRPVPTALAFAKNEAHVWSPPSTIWQWGVGTPVEAIRFAAANHLCVELGYKGTTRLVEPYALRQTKAGDIILKAVRVDNGETRSYRIDRMESAKATTDAFTPRYQIDFNRGGPIEMPPANSTTYIIECSYCGRRFSHQREDTALRAHNDRDGYPCSSRAGYLVDVQ